MVAGSDWIVRLVVPALHRQDTWGPLETVITSASSAQGKKNRMVQMLQTMGSLEGGLERGHVRS